MLKAVFLIRNKEKQYRDAVIAQMDRTVDALGKAGFTSGILAADSAEEAEAAAAEVREEEAAEEVREEAAAAEVREEEAAAGRAETLFLCDCGSLLHALLNRGAFAIGYAHADNTGEHFPGAPYIVEEPDLVDADSYIKMYQRAAGLPWTILETKRCVVREFIPEDLDAIYGLYDEQARLFLEPPSEDRVREGEILRAYIERIYGLYGFGHWAVISREDPGALVGRVGYSAITARQEQEARDLGICDLDADFGFLIGAKWRRKGIAEEVCSALLQFGFSELGFTCIRADARSDNAASIRLLTRLGFVPAGSCILPGKEGPAAGTVFTFRKK